MLLGYLAAATFSMLQFYKRKSEMLVVTSQPPGIFVTLSFSKAATTPILRFL